MAPRPSWKGYLKLSLVSCPVALYPSTSSSEKVSLHMLNGETGNRLKQQYVDAVTGDIVERDQRVKGYEIAKGDYVVLDDDELADVKLESSHTLDIERFVARSEIDRVYFDSNYFLAPDDKVGEEAFAVIREAMTARDVVGIARVVLFGKERMIMLEPRSKGLLGTTLRYGYEVREQGAYFDDLPSISPAKELLDLASHIIDTKAGHFEPEGFKDRYQDAVIALIKAKQTGRAAPASDEPARPSNVVNLMDALRRSLGQPMAGGQESAAAEPEAKSRSTPAKAASARAGKPAKRSPAKGAGATAAKKPAKAAGPASKRQAVRKAG